MFSCRLNHWSYRFTQWLMVTSEKDAGSVFQQREMGFLRISRWRVWNKNRAYFFQATMNHCASYWQRDPRRVLIVGRLQ